MTIGHHFSFSPTCSRWGASRNWRKPNVPTYTLAEAIARGLVEVVGAAVPDENGGILRLRKRISEVFRWSYLLGPFLRVMTLTAKV